MLAFNAAVICAVLISLIIDSKKTLLALKTACKKLSDIVPAFLIMFIAVSVSLYFINDTVIMKYLGGENRILGTGLAALIGSVALIPGFIAYPLCGILLTRGASYMVLAAFTTTLMMVGVITFPVEKKYFGARVTVIRNAMGLLIAMAVSLAIGIVFGELSI